MSENEEEQDLEFLRALEDELYMETLSDGSDGSLDSELEAELYQSVHFASSLVEVPANSVKELDDSSQMIHVDSGPSSDNSDKQSSEDCFEEKPLLKNEKPNPTHENEITDGPVNLYPEVEALFSSDIQKKEIPKKRTVAELFNSTSAGGALEDNSSGANEWKVIDADLIPIQRTKSRFRCKNCNERGHRTLECTEPKKEIICWLCGKIGHFKNRCPNELCFNCREPGHQKKKCRKPWLRSADVCNRCHAYGHFATLCPDRWRQYHHTVEKGEIVQATPDPSKTGDIFCYNCGTKGHFGHECLEDTNGFTDRSYPFVVKYDKYTTTIQQESKKRKKHLHEKHLDQEEHTPSKQRRVEDNEIEELRNQEELHDQIVRLTNFNHTMPNYPLQPLMSTDFGDFSFQNKKRKRKRNRGKKQNEPSNETTVSVGKKKKKRLNKRRRQEKRLKATSQTIGNIDANNKPLILKADVKKKNKKIKNQNKKGQAE